MLSTFRIVGTADTRRQWRGGSLGCRAVGPRWYVPFFLIFIVVIVALWGYLTGIDDDYVAPAGARSSFLDDSESDDGRDAAISDAKSARKGERPIARMAREKHTTAIALAGLFEYLAATLDEHANRLRSNVRNKPIMFLASGAFDAQAGRHKDAIEQYDDALSCDPGDPAVLSAKATSLVALGRFKAAADCYARAVERSPNSVIARYNYGVLLYRDARFSEAAEQFRALVEIKPDHARGQYNLASLAQRARRLSEARDAWTAFTRLRPGVASGWFNLGIVWMDFKNPQAAADSFSRALEVDATVPDFYVNLGLAYLAGGEDELALQMMLAADGVSPCDPIVLSQLADVHERLAQRNDFDWEHHRARATVLRDQIEMLRDELLDPHYLVRSRDDFEP